MDNIGWVILIGIGLFIYLLPSVIGFNRDNPFKWVIFVLNLVFGFTGVVWIILFIYVIFPSKKTILDPLIDPSGTMSAREYGKRIDDLKSSSNKIKTLRELYELKQSGAISTEEFNRMRNKFVN